MNRPTWDDYFLKVCADIAERSTCDRGKPGCVFVLDNQILASGYAGSPPGFSHCDEMGHKMEERVSFISEKEIDRIQAHHQKLSKGAIVTREEVLVSLINEGYFFNDAKKRFERLPSEHCVRTVHAEMNGILQAARRGVALRGSTVYVSMTPCSNCCMSLISIGVKRVVCAKKYHKGAESERMFRQANIEIEFKDEEILLYKKE